MVYFLILNKEQLGKTQPYSKKLYHLSRMFAKFNIERAVFTFEELNRNDFQGCPNFLHLIQWHTKSPY